MHGSVRQLSHVIFRRGTVRWVTLRKAVVAVFVEVCRRS